jgi:hypothetical protein
MEYMIDSIANEARHPFSLDTPSHNEVLASLNSGQTTAAEVDDLVDQFAKRDYEASAEKGKINQARRNGRGFRPIQQSRLYPPVPIRTYNPKSESPAIQRLGDVPVELQRLPTQSQRRRIRRGGVGAPGRTDLVQKLKRGAAAVGTVAALGAIFVAQEPIGMPHQEYAANLASNAAKMGIEAGSNLLHKGVDATITALANVNKAAVKPEELRYTAELTQRQANEVGRWGYSPKTNG